MKIIIDGRPLSTIKTGIGNFLFGSLCTWAKIRPGDDFYLAMPTDIHPSFDWKEFPKNITIVRNSNHLLAKLPHLLWLNIVLPRLAKKIKADIFFSALPCIPFLLGEKIFKVVVVHDVVNIEFKKTMQWTNRIANLLFFNRSIRTADILWANSNYTKNKINHYFPTRKCKDIFVGDSCDRSAFYPMHPSEETRGKLFRAFGLKTDYLLFVGSLEPRKNLSFLLSLMPTVYRKYHLQLLIVGANSWKDSPLQQIITDESFPREAVVFAKFVSEKDLALLYNCAYCFISASLNEGFGMPQLEAVVCDCPVITSNNSAMAELAEGRHGIVTVDGYEKGDWIEAIGKMKEERLTPDLSQFDDYDWNKILKRLTARLDTQL
jgi:glycosyltransferase involved in cell wall biosynthesis